MKIGIATWFFVLNHGALLQAIASKKLLEQMGHEVTFVDFTSSNHYEPPKRKTRDFLPWVIIPRKFFSVKKEKLFAEYKNANIVLKRIDSTEWNLVMVGSDEVFSVEGGFTKELFGIGYNCPVFSYAACAGPSLISDYSNSSIRNSFKESLKKMVAVGVRDENTRYIVKQIASIDSEITLDPVLLYGFKSIISNNDCVKRTNLCLYAYTFRWDEKEEIRMVKRFAKQNKLRIDSVGFYHSWCDKNINVGPEDILKEFSKHRVVLTDTFHGTVFSIITHTPFAVIVRNNSPKLIGLLKMLSLEDRIIDCNNSIEDIMSRKIDFDKVENMLEVYRKKSKDFINLAISKVNNISK